MVFQAAHLALQTHASHIGIQIQGKIFASCTVLAPFFFAFDNVSTSVCSNQLFGVTRANQWWGAETNCCWRRHTHDSDCFAISRAPSGGCRSRHAIYCCAFFPKRKVPGTRRIRRMSEWANEEEIEIKWDTLEISNFDFFAVFICWVCFVRTLLQKQG